MSVCEIKLLKADRDKCKRAESPARLGAQGQVRHAPGLAELEGQLRNLTPQSTDSDRADAQGHLVNDLAGLGEAAEPDTREATLASFAGFVEAQRAQPPPAFRGDRV